MQLTRFPTYAFILTPEHMKVQDFKQRSVVITATTGSAIVQPFYLQLESIKSLMIISDGKYSASER
jgi:hypothetical protein